MSETPLNVVIKAKRADYLTEGMYQSCDGLWRAKLWLVCGHGRIMAGDSPADVGAQFVAWIGAHEKTCTLPDMRKQLK
jgi:hypothetical protein